MYKDLVFIIVTLISMTGISATRAQPVNTETALPFNCAKNQYQVQGQQLVLNVDKNSANQIHLYVFYNQSNHSLWLDHPVKRPGVSAGWTSPIDPQRWTALALDRINFVVSCNELAKDGAAQSLPCDKVLKICAIENVKILSANAGSYWVAENEKTLQTFINRLHQRGVVWQAVP